MQDIQSCPEPWLRSLTLARNWERMRRRLYIRNSRDLL